jgi:hypothetical protein
LFSGPVADFLRADVPGSRTLAALRGYTSGDDTRPEAGAAEREDSASGVDAVSAFATYLSRDQERPDESPPLSTRPAYRIHDRPESRGIDDGLALLGLALPLYRLFASESSVPGQTVYPDQDSAVAAALAALTRKPRSLVGYFPLTQQLASEDVTPDELVAAVRDALRTGATGWFDGEAVQSRPPASRKKLADPAIVRVVGTPHDDPAESLRRALALGQGCCSVIDPAEAQVTDFATRALDLKARRAGASRLTPLVFDRALPGLACRLCDGEGRLSGVDESLILGIPSVTIRDDSFFTSPALACLRGTRRSLMLPALVRLRDSGLIDLLAPRSSFTPKQRAALWWGYPDKLFLKPGGDPDAPRDWHRWRGLVDYVLDGLPSAADQKWARSVRESRTRVACPRCGGTGLGWEARVREVEGTSLLTIRQRFKVLDLERWVGGLSCRTEEGREAARELSHRLGLAREAGLDQLPCGIPISEASGRDRLLARAMCACNNALAGAVVVFEPGETEVGDLGPLLTRTGRAAGLTWRREGEG